MPLDRIPTTPPRAMHLGDAGKRLWRHVAGLPGAGTSDVPALALMCQQLDLHAALQAEIREFGLTYETRGRRYANPAVAAASEVGRQLWSMMAQFGLSPADRSKIGVPRGRATGLRTPQRLAHAREMELLHLSISRAFEYDVNTTSSYQPAQPAACAHRVLHYSLSVDVGELSRLARYEHRTATPMTVLAVAFLFVYSAPIIWDEAPTTLAEVLQFLNLALWFAFVVDLGIRAWLSGRPVGYVVRHPIDLLLILLPMLRPLRVLRVFTAIQMLIRQGGRVSIGKTVSGAGTSALLLMFIAAVAMLDAERGNPESPIQSFGDAIWWSGATVTTVGYGDVYPVTWVGRWVAFCLMVVGISLIGVVTASIAAWFVGRADAVESDLVAEVRALRDELAQARAERLPE